MRGSTRRDASTSLAHCRLRLEQGGQLESDIDDGVEVDLPPLETINLSAGCWGPPVWDQSICEPIPCFPNETVDTATSRAKHILEHALESTPVQGKTYTATLVPAC